MISYPRELLLDSANNFGVVRTETIFGFERLNRSDFPVNNFTTTEPFKWKLNDDEHKGRSLHANDKKIESQVKSQSNREAKSKGAKKCIFKILKENKERKKKRDEKTSSKMTENFIVPLILGALATKSMLIPLALKALAFLSTKGLMMGFFATILASLVSLKGIFNNSNSYQNRRDNSKTQVEIVKAPYHSDELYTDEHYRRGDYVPQVPYVVLSPPDEVGMRNRRTRY